MVAARPMQEIIPQRLSRRGAGAPMGGPKLSLPLCLRLSHTSSKFCLEEAPAQSPCAAHPCRRRSNRTPGAASHRESSIAPEARIGHSQVAMWQLGYWCITGSAGRHQKHSRTDAAIVGRRLLRRQPAKRTPRPSAEVERALLEHKRGHLQKAPQPTAGSVSEKAEVTPPWPLAP